MKGTPFKTRRISPFMKADPGLRGGQTPIDPNANEGSEDAKVGFNFDKTTDYSPEAVEQRRKNQKFNYEEAEGLASFLPIAGEVIDAKNTVKDLINEDYFGAALNATGFAIPFVPGWVVKGGVKTVMNFLRKQPGVEEAIKKGEDLMGGSKTAGQMSARGGVGGDDLTTTQPFPENVNVPNDDMLKIQQDAFESSTMPKFNRLVDNVADYRGGGKISNPQNLADNMPFAERLEFIAENGHTDDWLFQGGVTKKGKKYFDARGVEIPLDPKVDYVPPGLRR
tara:strand:- start:256 stop:1095 length:840 start_codon:yes stop_codon:yes gene_type:complete